MITVTYSSSGRNKDQKLVGSFRRSDLAVGQQSMHYCPSTENVQQVWPARRDFGWPYAEIGQKMINGQLLFLTL